nr:MAG TPA: hypothetical protein [Bacteriophage sp.]
MGCKIKLSLFHLIDLYRQKKSHCDPIQHSGGPSICGRNIKESFNDNRIKHLRIVILLCTIFNPYT